MRFEYVPVTRVLWEAHVQGVFQLGIRVIYGVSPGVSKGLTVRALQPSTAPTVCLTASYPLQHLYNTLQSTALQQFYSLQPLQHPSASQ